MLCRWLYCLFLAINANFRLKLKARGIGDPELGTGLVYFVDAVKFKKHLEDRVSEEDVSQMHLFYFNRSKLCVDINRSRPAGRSSTQSIKRIQGHRKTSRFQALAQSSAVMVSFEKTVWSTFKKASGRLHVSPQITCTNLFRFVNMDFIFLSTVKDEDVKMIKISYDIACSWSVNLFRRIESYSSELQIPEDRFSLEYFIPKFHLPAHGPNCHTKYSFNYRPGVGRTHGENIESGWAHTNPAAVATREMGAGARHSALDSHWGRWNWRKIIGFGTGQCCAPQFNLKQIVLGALLLKNLHEARGMARQCEKVCNEFEQQAEPATINDWQAIKRSWERDPSKLDPYKLTEKRGSHRLSFASAMQKLNTTLYL